MKRHLDALVRTALTDAIAAGRLPVRRPPRYTLDAPTDPAFGDVACNAPMVLARETRRPPADIADAVLAYLRDPGGWFAGVEVAGPGFINFRLAPAFWRHVLGDALAQGEDYGRGSFGAGRRVEVEVARADAAAPLDVGRGRAAVVADAVARLLEAVGHDVEREACLTGANAGPATDGECAEHDGSRVDGAAMAVADQPAREPSDAIRDDLAAVRVQIDRRVRERTSSVAADVARLRDTLGRGVAQLVKVVGTADAASVPRLRASVQDLGHDAARLRTLVVQGVILTRGGTPLSTGTGRDDDLALRDVVEEIGVDAARFGFLLQRAEGPADLDLELAKRAGADNPVFYVQYAYARIAGALRQAAQAGVAPAAGADLAPLGDAEIEPLRVLGALPDVVITAARELEPHRVAVYATEVASAFHRYYNRHRVVTSDPALTRARLAVVGCFAQVLRSALHLTGVSVRERM